MAVSPHHCQLMAATGETPGLQWGEKGEFIAGKSGFEAVELVAVGMYRPPLPIVCYYLGLLPLASNGARIQLWGSSPEPLCLCIINVNHSQTR